VTLYTLSLSVTVDGLPATSEALETVRLALIEILAKDHVLDTSLDVSRLDPTEEPA
jgi:hypothetical protein